MIKLITKIFYYLYTEILITNIQHGIIRSTKTITVFYLAYLLTLIGDFTAANIGFADKKKNDICDCIITS